MRRITGWALSTIAALVLLFSYHTSTSSGTTSSQVQALAGNRGAASGSGSSAGSAQTYSGDTVQTRWGPVQVQITVEAGRISAADVLQVPSENPKDQMINGYAVPVLNDEAVQAQSADIDMVSGATVTSEGYVRSLQSAIDQANL